MCGVHADLLDSALKLACAGSSTPASQSDYRRALSTTYYAGFHFIVSQCADLLSNDPAGADLARAWLQVYRAIQHAHIRTACDRAAIEAHGFPAGIKAFAAHFPTLKRVREDADYNPRHPPINENYVLAKIGETEEAINQFMSVDRKHRQAFAVMVACGGLQRGS
jgi:hypothetical protein